jgi:cytoskeletal protein RodZ
MANKVQNKNMKKINKSLRKPPLILIGVLLVAAVVLLILELTNVTHFFHKAKTIAVTASPDTKGISSLPSQKSQSSDGTSSTSQDTTQPGDDKHQVGTTSEQLIAPSGTFANIYSAAADDQMTSSCGTNSGATCQIIFTNGDLTKELPAQVTDRGGGTSWAWKPKDIGLTPGTWHITAKAVLGNQVKTTSNDPLTLKVTQ